MADDDGRDDHGEPQAPVVELGTGFDGDEVSVLVDGHEVWHGDGVTTNYSVGLADVVTLPPLADGEGVLEIRVRRQARSQQIDLRAGTGAVRLRCDLDPTGDLQVGPAPEGPFF